MLIAIFLRLEAGMGAALPCQTHAPTQDPAERLQRLDVVNFRQCGHLDPTLVQSNTTLDTLEANNRPAIALLPRRIPSSVVILHFSSRDHVDPERGRSPHSQQ